MASFIRAFVGIPLETELKSAVLNLQKQLQDRSGANAVRWTRPEQLHLTLKFLGNVSTEALPKLKAALSQSCRDIAQFHLTLATLGAFPSLQRASVIWIGLRGELATLKELQMRIEESAGEFANHSEDREFHPHLTIGRVKAPGRTPRALEDALRASAEVELGEWRVTEVKLVQSKLSPQGSIYTPLETILLEHRHTT